MKLLMIISVVVAVLGVVTSFNQLKNNKKK